MSEDTYKELIEVQNQRNALRERFLNKRRASNLDLTEKPSKIPKISLQQSTLLNETQNSKDEKPNLIPSSSSSSITPSSSSTTKEFLLDSKLVELSMLKTFDSFVDDRIISIEELFELTKKNCGDAQSKQFESLEIAQFHTFLRKFSIQKLIEISDDANIQNCRILSIDHLKVSALLEDSVKSASDAQDDRNRRNSKGDELANIETLLGAQTAKEKEVQKLNEEIMDLINRPTCKEKNLVERFKSQRGSSVKQFCHYGTKEECRKFNGNFCSKLHFRKIIQAHTDESLGDCSFLNTCFHIETCKYVHYKIEQIEPSVSHSPLAAAAPTHTPAHTHNSCADDSRTLYPPQWIECDIRELDLAVLGKFAVIMADPPWDIHMELPYGTMSDEEMRKLGIPRMQTDGYLFLWVTGRAMELGRDCLRLWGYECVDEIIWVKTNQLQRIIRTGRTGHWLNHGKEHCLVGVKGRPRNMNLGLDCDVIVSEVRETSHKPDEIYGIIERLSPGTRKLELFGRPHNVQPNWMTLGNQLEGVRLVDPDVIEKFKLRYPNGIKGK